MNIITLKGRLTRDPEVRYTQNNIAVVNINIAVDRFTRTGEEKVSDFIDCTAFSGTAEFINKYYKKGQEILVNGRLQIDNYTDKDGNKRRRANVIISQVEFCGSKPKEENGESDLDSFDSDSLPF